jgi:hypothetical protein
MRTNVVIIDGSIIGSANNLSPSYPKDVSTFKMCGVLIVEKELFDGCSFVHLLMINNLTPTISFDTKNQKGRK